MTASAQYRLSRAFGNPATSVDLFHGELDLPLRLADRVTARYSSRVAATTWNDDAPTGVLGLGWSLELDRIVLADGAYFHGDVRLEPSGTRDGDLLFQSAREPLWEIRYGTATQSWRITRDDGSQARYRPTTYRSSWGKPRRYPVAWHLSELRAGGETHTWTYESDEVEEPPGLNRTAGVYLTQVAGPHGHARFQYVVTQPFESETRALSRLDVRSGAEAYTLRFLYELRDVSGHGPRFTKRFLVGVEHLGGEEVRLGYESDPKAPNPGALTSMRLPGGEKTCVEYAEAVPGGFERDVVAASPLLGGGPRVFDGPGFVVVTWEAAGRTALEVYESGGEWTRPWRTMDACAPGENARFAAGDGFFAIHPGSGSTLYLFARSSGGAWERHTVPVERSSDEPTLVAGDRFVVWHPGSGPRVHRFTLTPYGWRHETDEREGSTQVAVAARRDFYLVAWYDPETRTAPCRSFHRDATGAWHGRDLGGAGRRIDWDPGYARTFWALGDGFAVATFLADEQPRLRLLRWNADFSLAQDYQRTGRARESQVAGTLVSNGSLLLRFDGTAWHAQDTIAGRWRAVDTGSRVVTSGEDIFREERDGSLTRIGTFPASAWLCGGGREYLLFEDGATVTALLLASGEITGVETYAGRVLSTGDRAFATAGPAGDVRLHRPARRAPVVSAVRQGDAETLFAYEPEGALPDGDGARFARTERLAEGVKTVCAFHTEGPFAGLVRETRVIDPEGFEVFAEHREWSALPLVSGADSPLGVRLPAVLPRLSANGVLLSGVPLFELPAVLGGELDRGVLGPAVRTAFAGYGLPLRAAAAVVPGRHWEITDGRERYVIRRRGRFLQVLGAVRRHTRNRYDPATGHLLSRRTAETGADGTRQVVRADLSPAWRVPDYAGMRDARQLTAHAAQAVTNVTARLTVSSSATTYRHDPARGWAEHGSFTWRGDGGLAPPFDHRPGAGNPGWVLASPALPGESEGVTAGE